MRFQSYQGVVGGDGTATVAIQQNNAAVEWDVSSVSTNAPITSQKMTASMFLNGFFVTRTTQAFGDQATGPPDIILSRSDIITLVYKGGTPGDQIQVGIWYVENPAGTTADASP